MDVGACVVQGRASGGSRRRIKNDPLVLESFPLVDRILLLEVYADQLWGLAQRLSVKYSSMMAANSANCFFECKVRSMVKNILTAWDLDSPIVLASDLVGR